MSIEESAAVSRESALFLTAFFDELTRWGVRDVVVSPGSRSTPLAMTAYELSRRFPDRMRVFVDVDERGAAFFALGMGKATGRPAALICTSGTAVANYYPAVLEAESSRVPLIVLTGDRPPRLQGLGAPQTCDQMKVYGDHVRRFRQMPLPASDGASMAFARQMAREACIHARGTTWCPEGNDASGATGLGARLAGACSGGPVHLNFPFDEPLRPDFSSAGLFDLEPFESAVADKAEDAPDSEVFGRLLSAVRGIAPMHSVVEPRLGGRIERMLAGGRALVLAGEGTCATEDEARVVLAWARSFSLPLLADPLSGLRSFDETLVVDNYDSVIDRGGVVSPDLVPEVVVRFGRYPVSKRATQLMSGAAPLQIVVDPMETRDFNSATDLFVRCEAVDFARSMTDGEVSSRSGVAGGRQAEFAEAWTVANDAARGRIETSATCDSGFEGVFVRRAVELAPAGSCLFAASSMSVRALDTFYLKADKPLTVLCNRGLNGIDGTVSSALGAAQSFAQTTLLIGDLALLHDLNALSLQREVRFQRESAGSRLSGNESPSIVIVLLNNNGGAIFDMLPQKSTDGYFERLFLTPQDVNFEAAAGSFAVPYRRAETVGAFEDAYRAFLGVPGISLIEVPVPLRGLEERYAPCWSAGGAS